MLWSMSRHPFTDKDEVDDTDERRVKASIPTASDYKHIHFGVWAALGEAAKRRFAEDRRSRHRLRSEHRSDDGLTVVDMPNNGDATYRGNWVATVREADDDGDGDISLKFWIRDRWPLTSLRPTVTADPGWLGHP